VRAISLTLPSEPTQSVFRVIFDHAWGRLGNSRLLTFWEVVIWSAFAAHLGFDIFGFYWSEIDLRIAMTCFVVAAILTALLIGPWTYRTYSSAGLGEEMLRIVPAGPQVIVGARIAAVALMWARVVGPLIVIGVHLINISSPYSRLVDRWSAGLTGYAAIYGTMQNEAAYVVFGVLACISLVAMLMTWAALWGTKVVRIRSAFFLANYPVLIFISLTIFFGMIIGGAVEEGLSANSFSPDHMMTGFAAGVFVVFLLGAALSLSYFIIACRNWGARSK
jgi:hypothetical protein